MTPLEEALRRQYFMALWLKAKTAQLCDDMQETLALLDQSDGGGTEGGASIGSV